MKRCSDSRPVVAVCSHETSWGFRKLLYNCSASRRMRWRRLCRSIRGIIFTQSGLRCPAFAARDVARLQKADRVPLALSQFSRRAAERPCENWSAAPAAAPYFVHRTRSPPLPLLRLAASAAGSASAAQPPAHSGNPPACGRAPTGARYRWLLPSRFTLRGISR